MEFRVLIQKLRNLGWTFQGFWAGAEGVGRGRGLRLAEKPISGPTSEEIERAVEEGEFIEAGK